MCVHQRQGLSTQVEPQMSLSMRNVSVNGIWTHQFWCMFHFDNSRLQLTKRVMTTKMTSISLCGLFHIFQAYPDVHFTELKQMRIKCNFTNLFCFTQAYAIHRGMLDIFNTRNVLIFHEILTTIFNYVIWLIRSSKITYSRRNFIDNMYRLGL